MKKDAMTTNKQEIPPTRVGITARETPAAKAAPAEIKFAAARKIRVTLLGLTFPLTILMMYTMTPNRVKGVHKKTR